MTEVKYLIYYLADRLPGKSMGRYNQDDHFHLSGKFYHIQFQLDRHCL